MVALTAAEALMDKTINETIGKEGKYSNHPSDLGGETIWGITVAVARKNGYTGPMKSMPRETAFNIYRSEYYIKPGFARVATLFPSLGAELFDSGVNLGVAWPAIWLQQALNAFNGRAKFYADIKEDGQLGNGTIAALTSFKNKRGAAGEKVLLRAVDSLQGARYLSITASREANEDFVYGWFDNRVGGY